MDEPFPLHPLLYCTISPQALKALNDILSAPIMVFIVALWLIRHRFDVDEPFPLLYCAPPPDIHWLERSHNGIHSCRVVLSCRVVN